jgi:hypothetical protein
MSPTGPVFASVQLHYFFREAGESSSSLFNPKNAIDLRYYAKPTKN